MRGITSKLVGVVNETDVRGEAMVALIEKYLNMKTEYGLRSIGDDPTLKFPILFVEPSPGYNADLVSGKYHIFLTYNLFWYVVDNNSQDIVSYCSSIGHCLEKLFSNNALNDLGTANSKNFCIYEPFWTDVQKFSFKCLPTFLNPLDKPTGKWMRLGRGTVEIETWIIR